MSVISRYIISSYTRIIALSASSFIVIYLVIDFLEKLGRFTRAEGEFRYIALFFLFKIPEITVQIIPLAVLMSTLLTLGMLSRHSEITAMRGCGISLGRIAAPLIITAFAISVLTFIVAEFMVPASFAQMKYIQEVLIEKKSPNTFFRQQNIWYREDTRLLQARIFSPENLTLKGITLWDLGPDMKPARRIEANTAVLTTTGWLLKDVVIREMGGGGVANTTTKAEFPVQLKLKVADLKVLQREADTMGIFSLKRYCNKLRQRGYDDTRYIAQFHSRIALPFASLVMAFLGVPFALRSGRTSGIAVGIGLSLGIGFCYYAFNAVLLSFGQGGVLPPLVSAWAANLIFAAVGMWLLMTVDR